MQNGEWTAPTWNMDRDKMEYGPRQNGIWAATKWNMGRGKMEYGPRQNGARAAAKLSKGSSKMKSSLTAMALSDRDGKRDGPISIVFIKYLYIYFRNEKCKKLRGGEL